jgi:pyruvate/2-oxoglutarate dehydrogenase complex dihydrolipoamide acyltransferase (E2) component
MASEDRAWEDDGRMSSDESYAVRAGQDHGENVRDPDLQLDVPALSVEEIELEVEDLKIHLSIQAELADLVKIKVGLDAELGEVKLGIKGVQAEAQLKASLDNVRAIFGEVLASLQHSPRFFRQSSDTGVVEETDDASNSPAQEAGKRPGQSEATGAAARRARELGVDLSGLQGTGAGGRIVVRDVTRAAEE